MTSSPAEIWFIYVVFRFLTSTKARQLPKMGPPLEEAETLAWTVCWHSSPFPGKSKFPFKSMAVKLG